MRTTVTIDADVQVLLNEAMRQTGQGFKPILNQAIRKGLADIVRHVEEPRFVVHAKAMGLRSGIDPTRLQELADDLEVEAHLELTRKLEQSQQQPPKPRRRGIS